MFGSHEDDLLMTEGAQGLREQLSVGFLELSDDLTQRLPVPTETDNHAISSSFLHYFLIILCILFSTLILTQLLFSPFCAQNFLNTFDAVVLGESSFSFGRGLIEEILQMVPPTRGQKPKPSLLERLNSIGGLNPDMGMF